MYLNLKMALVEKGVSIEEAATLLGIHRNTFSAKINGKAKFYIDELCKIRDAYFPQKTLDELSEKAAA